jgi:hypothetical protein
MIPTEMSQDDNDDHHATTSAECDGCPIWYYTYELLRSLCERNKTEQQKSSDSIKLPYYRMKDCLFEKRVVST